MNAFFKQTTISNKQQGFTLVELLVAIFIIGVLASVVLANIVGMRGRARDTRKKGELESMKKALRIYYNDHQAYPDASGTEIDSANIDAEGSFIHETDAEVVYMRNLPEGYGYYVNGDNDEYRLTIQLENISDETIDESQVRCPASGDFNFLSYDDDLYVVCED